MRTRTPITLAAGIAAALLLAGCSATSGGSAGMSGMTQSSGMPSMDHSSSTATASAAHNSADLTFAEAMIPHHVQAVQMSDILLKKTDVNASVLALAKKIKAVQSPEITELNGFLTS